MYGGIARFSLHAFVVFPSVHFSANKRANYRDEYTDVVTDGATESESADGSDYNAYWDGDVSRREDKVEFVVDVDKLVECWVRSQPYPDTHRAQSRQLKYMFLYTRKALSTLATIVAKIGD